MQDNGIKSFHKTTTYEFSSTLKVKLDSLYSTGRRKLLKAVPKQKCRKSLNDVEITQHKEWQNERLSGKEINTPFQDIRS